MTPKPGALVRMALALALAGLGGPALRPAARADGENLFQPLDPGARSEASDVPDVPGLPRVLLLGDSISFGYLLPVRLLLEREANVHHGGSRRFDSGYALGQLDDWLGAGHWDVIHFNYGLWDMKYVDRNGTDSTVEAGKRMATVAEYERNLRAIARRLRSTGARIVFATSTPVPPGTLSRIGGDEDAYNRAAVRVMRELAIPIDDLHAWVLSHSAQLQLPYDVHFTPAGYDMLAAAVTASIRAVLPRSPPRFVPPPPAVESMAGREAIAASAGLSLRWIPPGSFRLGSSSGGQADERPATRVRLSRGFWIGRCEVTQGEWRALMGAAAFQPRDGSLPAFNVSWNDAVAFCRRLTSLERACGRVPAGYEYRLPTEAEWEYACRAGSEADAPLADTTGWDWMNTGGSGAPSAQPTAQKLPNAWGLYDTLGNVWEWCFDWYGPYPGGTETDPAGPATGIARVMRGGSWWEAAAACRPSTRGWAGPNDRYVSVGFRVALGPEIDSPPAPAPAGSGPVTTLVESPPL